MKSVLPFRGDDTLMYSITYDLTTPESRELGSFEESGYIVEPTEGELQDILLQANRDYGIYMPVGVGSFANPIAPEDNDYFTKGHEKYYTLFINKTDGSRLNQEELDFVTALLNEGKYSFDEDSNRFYEWGGTPEFGIGGWIGGTLIGGFLGYQVGKAVGYGRAVQGYAGGGEIKDSLKDWYIKNYPTDDLGEEINDTATFEDLWNGLNKGVDVYDVIGVGDSLVRERLFEQLSNLKSVSYEFIYNRWLDPDRMITDNELKAMYPLKTTYEGGGEIKVGDRVKLSYIHDTHPKNNEVGTLTEIKEVKEYFKPFGENDYKVVQSGVITYNDGTEETVSDIHRKGSGLVAPLEKVTYQGGGDIPEGFHKMPDGTIMPDSAHFEGGGEIRYFDRHANMGDETRREILEYTEYPILKEYFGKDGKDSTEYEQVEGRLDEVGFKGRKFSNYLYGMFDGYDYTKTKDFQDELAKIKKADPKFHLKIMRIVKEIQSYPTSEQPNQGNFGLGGLLLAGGFGAYVGYKIGRAKPKKKGFQTEKKIARKVKSKLKYEGGGGVEEVIKVYPKDNPRDTTSREYSWVNLGQSNMDVAQKTGTTGRVVSGNNLIALKSQTPTKTDYHILVEYLPAINEIGLVRGKQNSEPSPKYKKYIDDLYNHLNISKAYEVGGETITKPRPTITPTETPVKPDKDNPYKPKVKPRPKADYLISNK